MAAYWEIVLNCQFAFSHLGFWSGNFFLTAPFPVHCLLESFLTTMSIDTSNLRDIFKFDTCICKVVMYKAMDTFKFRF